MKTLLFAVLVLVPILVSEANAATTYHLFFDRDWNCVIARNGSRSYQQLLANRDYTEISAFLRSAEEAHERATQSGCRTVRQM